MNLGNPPSRANSLGRNSRRLFGSGGGWLGCVLDGEFVWLTGQAFTYLEGSIVL